MSKNPYNPLPYQSTYDFGKELIIDGFAGGGGASTGIEMALGVSPDVAINHDAEAIALHLANHPNTRHYISDIFEVDPILVTMGRPVGLFWISPDCKHHSKAKGGKPRDKKIRSLAWVAIKWAKQVKPRIVMLENVEEFKDWCPIDKEGMPVKEKKGETFKKFIQEFKNLGYEVDYKELRACDYGAPTTRKRLFLIARCDGKPIIFPKPTHADVQSLHVKSKKLKPYKTAAEIIDWSIPTHSIFLNKKEAKEFKVRRPLSDKTMERIAKGFKKFVLDSDKPYTVDKRMLPYISTYYGKTKNSGPRGQKVDKPLATITAGGLRHGLVTPYIGKAYSTANNTSVHAGHDIKSPLHTITTFNNLSLVAPYMMAIDNLSSKNATWSAKSPLTTITAKGRHGVVAAFLYKYYGQEGRQKISDPLHTIRTVGHFGLVEIKGIKYQVMDIGFRMLSPRELYNAQGFPSDYKIDVTMPNGKKLSKTAQVRMCGNSVVPLLAKALVEANFQVETVEKVKVA